MPVAVSIIVPCYNVAPYLDACLESLVSQTLREIEIICVNDGSTDETPERLRAWAARDSRITIVNQANAGLSAARNAGMDIAAGEYIGFVDSDDEAEYAMYARLLEEARQHDADVTACGYTAFSGMDGTVLEAWSHSPDAGVEKHAREADLHAGSVWRRMDAVAWNKLYNRQFLDACGVRFEPSFRKGEDDVFWLMLLPHVNRLAVIPDRLYRYRRQREGSISHGWETGGSPWELDMQRLEYVTAYWGRLGRLDAASSSGWVAWLLKRFLLAHVSSREEVLPALPVRERLDLARRCREWFAAVGLSPAFDGLRAWDRRFCLALDGAPLRALPCARLWWRLLSHCSGRRGRYYRLKLALSNLS